MIPQIAPSILSFSHGNLSQDLQKMKEAGAAVIHVDVMDGQFVPPITFGDGMVKSVKSIINVPVEAHLMTLNPENQVESFAKAGCDRFIFQAEATFHSNRLVQQIHNAKMQAGVAINPGTPVEAIIPILNLVDLVLIMTVNPGYGGQSFLKEVVSKIERVRKLRTDLIIEVDGGIDPGTIGIAAHAGANLFVVGSYLLRPESIRKAFEELERACD